MRIIEDHTVKCRTQIQVLFHLFNLCLSVLLDSLMFLYFNLKCNVGQSHVPLL